MPYTTVLKPVAALAACVGALAAQLGPSPSRAQQPTVLPANYVNAPTASNAREPVLPGLEVLLRDSLHLVRGKRVGLITNHTAVTRDG
ncbi:MAG TPA: hypothetical protein VGB66_19205, partial [Longimicrobium sp.]